MKHFREIISVVLAVLLLLCGCADERVPTGSRETTKDPSGETTLVPESTKPTEEETPVPYAEVSYDAAKQTVYLQGTGDYASVKIPEGAKDAQQLIVQDDQFTLLMYLDGNVWDGRVPDEMKLPALPEYVERTEQSLRFVRKHMLSHTSDPRVKDLASRVVDMDYGDRYSYGYDNSEKRLVIHLNRAYWHRDFLYVFCLLPAVCRGWEQMGYAYYLTECVNPDSEMLLLMKDGVSADAVYYATFMAAAGSPDIRTGEDLRVLYDAFSRFELEAGFGSWDTDLVSNRLQKRRGSGDWYRGDQKMSETMAASFVAWLIDKYSEETVLDFVCELKDFTESFGDSFDNVFEAWKNWLRETYEYVENPPKD